MKLNDAEQCNRKSNIYTVQSPLSLLLPPKTISDATVPNMGRTKTDKHKFIIIAFVSINHSVAVVTSASNYRHHYHCH